MTTMTAQPVAVPVKDSKLAAALKDAAIGAAIALVLFAPIVGLRTETTRGAC